MAVELKSLHQAVNFDNFIKFKNNILFFYLFKSCLATYPLGLIELTSCATNVFKISETLLYYEEKAMERRNEDTSLNWSKDAVIYILLLIEKKVNLILHVKDLTMRLVDFVNISKSPYLPDVSKAWVWPIQMMLLYSHISCCNHTENTIRVWTIVNIVARVNFLGQHFLIVFRIKFIVE